MIVGELCRRAFGLSFHRKQGVAFVTEFFRGIPVRIEILIIAIFVIVFGCSHVGFDLAVQGHGEDFALVGLFGKAVGIDDDTTLVVYDDVSILSTFDCWTIVASDG